MGYFSNGTEGMIYESMYCEHCWHYSTKRECPVLVLHALWNYDAVGKEADETKKLALDVFIPREGIENEKCTMFYEERVP